jgi:hypothetical protein
VEATLIGDGENINNVIRTGSMDDVGTRIQFLTELYELWQTGIDILDRYDRHSPYYAEKREELEHATKLLMFHMQKDYKESTSFSGEDPRPNPNI